MGPNILSRLIEEHEKSLELTKPAAPSAPFPDATAATAVAATLEPKLRIEATRKSRTTSWLDIGAFDKSES